MRRGRRTEEELRVDERRAAIGPAERAAYLEEAAKLAAGFIPFPRGAIAAGLVNGRELRRHAPLEIVAFIRERLGGR